MKAGSQTHRLLEVLRRDSATNAQIHALAGHMIVNSRVAELRKQGYVIECEYVGGKGANAYRYSLLAEPPKAAPTISSFSLPVVGAQLSLADVAA